MHSSIKWSHIEQQSHHKCFKDVQHFLTVKIKVLSCSSLLFPSMFQLACTLKSLYVAIVGCHSYMLYVILKTFIYSAELKTIAFHCKGLETFLQNHTNLSSAIKIQREKGMKIILLPQMTNKKLQQYEDDYPLLKI